MKKIRTVLIVLGLVIALVPVFLSVAGGFKNLVIEALGLLVAVLSYLYVHEQQKKN
ncbi:MAG: hypothetical protein WCQ00_01510 [bacterium]